MHYSKQACTIQIYRHYCIAVEANSLALVRVVAGDACNFNLPTLSPCYLALSVVKQINCRCTKSLRPITPLPSTLSMPSIQLAKMEFLLNRWPSLLISIIF